ncbi:protein FAM180B isoform X2 [Pogoniulus pusillus]|uniref:protein FAM180B isoform X2 n=1 Tax=Pogoniulus pusillus TaxID=488313 RepID=UPI0030B991CF
MILPKTSQQSSKFPKYDGKYPSGSANRNTEKWTGSKRGCWDQKQRGQTLQQGQTWQQTALVSHRQGSRQGGRAAMARARLGNWLILCMLAGSQRLTDEHPHGRDSANTRTHHHGPEDADIMLEMLWGGLDVQANGTSRLWDEELASLRPARRLLHILEDEVPKTPPEVEQHLRYYSLTDSPLLALEFHRLLLTGVYCAYQDSQLSYYIFLLKIAAHETVEIS